jgi:putative transposase
MKIDYYTPFYKDQYYHIYNRGNNGETIFYKPDNYLFFLKRLSEYLSNCVEIFAYCLLPNHFHLIIRVKDIVKVSEQFRLLFLSYSKAINKQTGRSGSLFQKRYKRTIIESIPSLCRAIVYVHTNPVHHGITSDFKNYKYSSFQSLLSDGETKLKRDNVLKWFGRKDNFIKLHRERIDSLSIESFFVEN